MRIRRLAIPLMSLLFVGCASLSGTPLATPKTAALKASQAQSLYPLTKGLQWRYSSVSRSGDGPDRPGHDQIIKVTASEHVQGQVRAVVIRKFGDRELPPTLAVADGRAVTLSRLNSPEDGSISVLVFPLEPQNSWPGRSWAHAQETISVVGTESITVPAGTYTATRLQHRIAYATGKSDYLHYWYAPGVGMVKAIEGLTIDLGSGPVLQQVTAELLQFDHGEVSASPD